MTGHSAVIRRYTDDRLTVIMLANLDDGGFGIDAMSKHIAGMYVPGVDVHSLTPASGADAAETARVRAALTSIGAGVEHEAAPGLATRLPPPVRERIAAALPSTAAFESLGGEQVGAGHFNLDANLARLAWYRARTSEGERYFTVRLSREGRLLGVIVED